MKHLKKSTWLLAMVLFFGITNSVYAQTLKEVFSSTSYPLLYLGVDFTKTKLLDIGNPEDIRSRMYGSINQLVVNEPKKYDLKGAFYRDSMGHDFAAVTKSNGQINVDEIISTNPADFKRLKENDISDVVKNLDLSGKTGVGVLFVVEAFRKQEKKGDAAIWVAFVDMKAKKVLLTERFESTGATGIGFRNYWTSTIRYLLEEIEKHKYKEWKAKYGS